MVGLSEPYAAEVLASNIHEKITVSEYIVLATERFRDANYQLAEEYFKKAVNVSRSNLHPSGQVSNFQQHIALKALAVFYFQNQPLRSYEKAKDNFAQAVELLESGSDPNSFLRLGETYEIWGLNSLYNQFTQDGNGQIEKAKRYYSQLPPPQSPYDPISQQLIENLDKKIEAIKKNLNP
ncbi:hypothetical protein [Nostoc sp.]|uniref:hypothetical protein n=1 Tax=Nostoc sp. TaxID=1180 RepID=UPI002FF79507